MTISTTKPTPKPLFPEGYAFVAGGSGGIGSAVCIALAQAGCDVALTYNTNRAAAEEVAAQVRDLGRRAHVMQLTLEDVPAVTQAVESVAALSPHGIHTVVYATGPYVPMKFLSKVSPQEFKDFILSDTVAAFNLVSAALPHVRRSRGSLVAVTTTALDRWAPQDGMSAVPKAALARLFAGIAREEGRNGVRANSVALGVIQAGIATKWLSDPAVAEKYLAAMARNVPLQRLGTAEEAADAVVFLASSRAGYTTGQVLKVDGGFTT
jgi:NAD(P)-dependent dehydrogenase (short-subunit alcohol dehydrogenase family)